MEPSQIKTNTQSQNCQNLNDFLLSQIRILERLAEGAPLKEVLEKIVGLIEEYTQGICSILLLDRETGRLTHGAAPNLPPGYLRAIDGSKIGPTAGSCGTAAYRGERVIVDDIETHQYWKDYSHFALRYGLRACWSSPIFSSEHEVLGTFAVYYKEPHWPADVELKWVDSATHLTALALMKAQSEFSLRRSEERYRQLMETTHEGVISLDIEGNITFVNSRTLQMLGYQLGALIGQNVLKFIHPSEIPKVESMLARRRLGLSDQYEVQLNPHDGRDLWVIAASSPILNEFGEVEGMLGMLTDITQRKQVEVALQKSDSELRTMFEGATAAIVLVDMEYRPIKCNPAVESLLGYCAKDLGEISILDLVHPVDLHHLLEKKQHLESGEVNSYQNEVRLRQKSENYASVRLTVSQIISPQGTRQNAIVMIEDIRETKRFEMEMEAAERLRALTFDSVADILFYLKVEPQNRFQFLSVNESFLRATGLREDQVVGRYVDEVIPEPSLSLVLEKYKRSILERRTYKWDEVTEYPAGIKYGEAVVTPLFDQNGQCKGLVGTVHDITERKQAEKRIAAQAALLDCAHDAILMSGLDGAVHYWNQGAVRLYGWTATEALGHKITELLYRDTVAFYEAQNKVLQNGDWNGEICQFTKEGRGIVVEGSWTLLRDSQNKPFATLSINTDITEKKKLREQVSLAQRMDSLGTFAGGIAHDFNNLLTAIIGNINLAQQFIPSSNNRAREKLIISNSACYRAAELVRRILTFSSQPEKTRIELNLKSAVEETLQLLRSILPAMIELRTSWATEIPLISADAAQIQQVMMNLTTNSIQAMGDHGTLGIAIDTVVLDKPMTTSTGVLEPQPYVRLTVTDTGPGIDSSTLTRIFEPFFTTKPPGRGTGLGLSVVHGIVRDYGGGILVTSEMGVGAKFEIYFPAAKIPLEDKSIKLQRIEPSGHGEQILYVDDDASILALGTEILEGCGYHVASFIDPVEAFHAFKKTPSAFDALLTDFAMPHMSGLELAQSILGIKPEIPIILTSGYLRSEDEQLAMSIGVREILGKPGSVTELLHSLGRLFQSKNGG